MGVLERYSYLRRFSPAVINGISFFANQPRHPCISAIESLHNMNLTNKRSLPDSTSIAFAPKKVRALLKDEQGRINKRVWETVLLLKIQDEIRAGNLSVKSSKRFGPFDDYFISKEKWETRRHDFYKRAGLPVDSAEVSKYLNTRLKRSFDLFQHHPQSEELGQHWAVPTDSDKSLLSDEQAKKIIKTQILAGKTHEADTPTRTFNRG